ncbi:MAG: chemotaxis protein CheD [Bryobacteraceae bacterium]
MSLSVVGVADCQVSNDEDAVLVTYALGSCIGLLIHDPVAKVGGLLHYMLPESSLDLEKADRNPYMFADTGIPRLFHSAYRLGAEKRRLVVTAVGGAQVLDREGTFNIGQRNHMALRKILWKAGVLLQAEDVGGNASRTVRLEVNTGKVLLRRAEEPEQELLKNAPAKKGVSECHSQS